MNESSLHALCFCRNGQQRISTQYESKIPFFLLFFWQYQPELFLGEISWHKYHYISLKISLHPFPDFRSRHWFPSFVAESLGWDLSLLRMTYCPVPGKLLEDVISLPTAAILIVTSWHSRLKQAECMCMLKGIPKNFTLSLGIHSNEEELCLGCPPFA